MALSVAGSHDPGGISHNPEEIAIDEEEYLEDSEVEEGVSDAEA